MRNITDIFEDMYKPQKALVIYQSLRKEEEIYIEAYDMDKAGRPINAHPLSLSEITALATTLNAAAELKNERFISKGMLPENIVSINPSVDGHAIWYTPVQEVNMLFAEPLGIPNGRAFVPGLIWKATKAELYIYALKKDKKPTITTELYNAPYFNIYQDGKVCMGTVDIEAHNADSLETFMEQWQSYFWNSYFSHLISDVSPVTGNIVQLWQQQVNSGSKFPVSVLVKSGKTLQNILR